MRVCLKCGVQVPEDTRFCAKCGAPLGVRLPVSFAAPSAPPPEDLAAEEKDVAHISEEPIEQESEVSAEPIEEAVGKTGAPFEAEELPAEEAVFTPPAEETAGETGALFEAEELPAEEAVQRQGAQAEGSPLTKDEAPMSEKSVFKGGAFVNFFIGLLSAVASILTLGFLAPTMICWRSRWVARNTYIGGRRQVFDGKAGELFGPFLLWLLLSVLTLGVYYVFGMSLNVRKWVVGHTHFEANTHDAEGNPVFLPEDGGLDLDAVVGDLKPAGVIAEKESFFDGRPLEFFGMNLVVLLVTVVTLSFGSYWAACYRQKWLCKHTVIDGCRLSFRGNAWQLFAWNLLWTFLSVITLGIYSFWLVVKRKRWFVAHTSACNTALLPPMSARRPSVPLQSERRPAPVTVRGSALSVTGYALAFLAALGQLVQCFVMIGSHASVAAAIVLGAASAAGLACTVCALVKKSGMREFAIAGTALGAIGIVLCLLVLLLGI